MTSNHLHYYSYLVLYSFIEEINIVLTLILNKEKIVFTIEKENFVIIGCRLYSSIDMTYSERYSRVLELQSY